MTTTHKRHVVFVYGTLLVGQPNARLLASARLLGVARTAPNFRLYDLGHFPAMVYAPGGADEIEGELYEVDDETLARLDRLEGVPNFYHRRQINVRHRPDGAPAIAMAYAMHVTRLPAHAREIGSSWLAHIHKQQQDHADDEEEVSR